jgi:hypothetical protein
MASVACASSTASAETPPWIEQGGFLVLFYSCVAMFWGIVFVCEEFGVPSITAFCKRHRISDSLAGSIFIGTGLSLPVFFISVVGMLIDNAAIGIGAVVGGNLFNHLVTVGTSIYVSPNRIMKLDPVVYTRESLIYLLTCVLIIWSTEGSDLNDKLSRAHVRSEWKACLSISWLRSFALILVYIAYCIFDANFYLVENWFHRGAAQPSKTASNHDLLSGDAGGDGESQVEFAHQCTISTAKSIVGDEILHVDLDDLEDNHHRGAVTPQILPAGDGKVRELTEARRAELDAEKMEIVMVKSM